MTGLFGNKIDYIRRATLNDLSKDEIIDQRGDKNRIKNKAIREFREEYHQRLSDSIDLAIYLHYNDPQLLQELRSDLTNSVDVLSNFIMEWYDVEDIEEICKNITIPDSRYLVNNNGKGLLSKYVALENAIELLSRMDASILESRNGIGPNKIQNRIDRVYSELKSLNTLLLERSTWIEPITGTHDLLLNEGAQVSSEYEWLVNIIKKDKIYCFPDIIDKPEKYQIKIVSSYGTQVQTDEIKYHLEIRINVVLSFLKILYINFHRNKKEFFYYDPLFEEKGTVNLHKIDEETIGPITESQNTMINDGLNSIYLNKNLEPIEKIRTINSYNMGCQSKYNISTSWDLRDYNTTGIKKYFGEPILNPDKQRVGDILRSIADYQKGITNHQKWDRSIKESISLLEEIDFIKIKNRKIILNDNGRAFMNFDKYRMADHYVFNAIIDEVKSRQDHLIISNKT